MTKRKVEHDLTPPGQRKASARRNRVAFTAPNAATKVLLKRNDESSPLLKLAPEIRDRIWREVLGDRLVHIDYVDPKEEYFVLANDDPGPDVPEDQSPWRVAVCEDQSIAQAPDSPEKEHFIKETHRACYLNHDDMHSAVSPKYWDKNGLALTLLRTSRQTYAEANQILWSSSTFFFSDPKSMREFMRTRSIHQKRSISSLRLDMPWEWEDCQIWDRVLAIPMLQTLSNVKSLQMNITKNFLSWEFAEYRDEGDVRLEGDVPGLMVLAATLPLVNVEVSFPHSLHLSEDEKKDLWPEGDRNWFAASVRDALLDRDGAIKYIEEERRVKEAKRKEGGKLSRTRR